MRATTWAILGSLAINVVLGLAIATLFGACRRARPAGARAACPHRPSLHRGSAHGVGSVTTHSLQLSATRAGAARSARAERNIASAA